MRTIDLCAVAGRRAIGNSEPSVEEGPEPFDPCQRLWQAVVLAAAKDLREGLRLEVTNACSGKRAGEPDINFADAERFFFGDRSAKWLRHICILAELDVDRVRQGAARVIGKQWKDDQLC